MRAIFLTSSLDTNDKDEYDVRTPKVFPNNNGIHENFKKYIKTYDNFLFVASDMDNYAVTDMYADITFKSFEMTMPFKNYQVLDGRNLDQAKSLIENADFILLCGGHVPTQHKFFTKINLHEIIRCSDAVICGVSAGSMNCADLVYSCPELEGEATDPDYVRYLDGLGLTSISIYPHWDDSLKEDMLDGLNIFEDIMLKDSYTKPFYAYNDGSYIMIADNKTILCGKAYYFENGTYKCVQQDNEYMEI